jgi:endoplasmic reticulum Man9GlcNAc2 1,2-alpha-mannosidase
MNGNGRPARFGGIFAGDKKELPMYKDKPYNYGRPARRSAEWRTRGAVIALLLLIFLSVYFVGMSMREQALRDTKSRPTPWFLHAMHKHGKNVNWSERREQVREAFKVSWSAYERYAWGMLSTSTDTVRTPRDI